MKYFLKLIFIFLFFIFISYLIGRGNIFWGIFLLFMLISYIHDRELKKIGNELEWISKGIMYDDELRNFKENKALHYIAKGCLYDKIKKGMKIKEFATILLQEGKNLCIKLDGIKSDFLRERAEELTKLSEEENYILIYRDYGAGSLTPELHFKFKKGSLVRIKKINCE